MLRRARGVSGCVSDAAAGHLGQIKYHGRRARDADCGGARRALETTCCCALACSCAARCSRRRRTARWRRRARATATGTSRTAWSPSSTAAAVMRASRPPQRVGPRMAATVGAAPRRTTAPKRRRSAAAATSAAASPLPAAPRSGATASTCRARAGAARCVRRARTRRRVPTPAPDTQPTSRRAAQSGKEDHCKLCGCKGCGFCGGSIARPNEALVVAQSPPPPPSP